MTYVAPDPITWINGHREPSEVSGAAQLRDPNNGDVVQAAHTSSCEQVERAIASAADTHRQGAWRSCGVANRAAALEDFATRLASCSEDIAVLDAVNTGVPITTTRMFASSLSGTVRQAAALAVERGDHVALAAEQGPVNLRRVPWGATALLLPWNAPSAILVKKMAYALAAGAPVVVKPSPFAPWSAQLIAKAASETLPPGLFALVLGGKDTGRQLCADPRVKAISMTGATSTGQAIAQVAARNLTRLRLELGSNNPVVVCADADVADTARSLYEGMTKLNGQWCEAPRAVFAHSRVHRDLVDALSALVHQTRVGSSLDDETQMGPMAYAARRSELERQRAGLESQGHRVAASAAVPDTGAFFGPTVIEGSGGRLDEEIFGPMLVVESCASERDAVDGANKVAGGLAAYVYTRDVTRGLSLSADLYGGEVKINGTSVLDMSEESAQSFFGHSGIGGHGDRDVLDFYAGKQVAGLDVAGAPI